MANVTNTRITQSEKSPNLSPQQVNHEFGDRVREFYQNNNKTSVETNVRSPKNIDISENFTNENPMLKIETTDNLAQVERHDNFFQTYLEPEQMIPSE